VPPRKRDLPPGRNYREMKRAFQSSTDRPQEVPRTSSKSLPSGPLQERNREKYLTPQFRLLVQKVQSSLRKVEERAYKRESETKVPPYQLTD